MPNPVPGARITAEEMATIEPRVLPREVVERTYRRETSGQAAAHIPGYIKGLYAVSPAPCAYAVSPIPGRLVSHVFVPYTEDGEEYCRGWMGEVYHLDDQEGLPLVRPVVETIDDIDRLPDPESFGPSLVTDAMRAEAAERKKRYWLSGGLPGPDLTMNWPNGIQRMMEWLATDPDLVAKYMDYTYQVCWNALQANILLGVDEVSIGCCYGSANLISPRAYRELTDPLHIPLAEEAHRHGIRMKIHMCGRSVPNWEAIADQGFDAMETVDPLGGCTIREAKRRIGDRMVVFGNVNTLTLAFGSVEDVVAETRKCLEDGMPGGGFILGLGDTTVSRATPLRNLLAVRDTYEKYGWYAS